MSQLETREGAEEPGRYVLGERGVEWAPAHGDEGEGDAEVFTDPATRWTPEQAGRETPWEGEGEEVTHRPVDWAAAVVRLAPRVAAGILHRAQRGDSAFALPAAVIFAGVLLCRGEGGSDVA